MGVCVSKMKEVAGGIDKEAIEMDVKGKKLEIAQKTKALATDWQAQIASCLGSSEPAVKISRAEVLPLKDTEKIELVFDSKTQFKDLMVTALYVTTNTIYRDALKKEIWADLAAGMKEKKLPEAIINHGEAGAGPAIDMALDKQVQAMKEAIEHDKPLVTEEEIKAVQEYQAKKAAEKAEKAKNAAKTDEKDAGKDAVKQEAALNEKEGGAVSGEANQQRGTFEQPQAIRA